MALEIVVTPGATDANSYVTLAEAEAIALGFVNKTSWDAADEPTKNASLVQATHAIDTTSLNGTSNGQQDDSGASNYQPLFFPVNNETYIPESVKQATTAQAMSIIRSGEASQATIDVINAGIEEQDTGQFREKFRKSWISGGSVGKEARAYLGNWLSSTRKLEFGV